MLAFNFKGIMMCFPPIILYLAMAFEQFAFHSEGGSGPFAIWDRIRGATLRQIIKNYNVQFKSDS